jgi:hypothetical protein
MENERKATPRQLAYIQQLRKRQGKESIEMEENLSFQEASKMIERLMEGPNGQDLRPVRINEARLGMVMKECYRYFRHYEKDILKEHRQRFKENVIKTYQLFTEIAQELEQSSQMEA